MTGGVSDASTLVAKLGSPLTMRGELDVAQEGHWLGGSLRGTVQPTARLRARAKDLVTALKLVRKFAGGEKKIGEAALGFDGADMLIGLTGVTHRAPATGEWPGTARVPGDFVMRFVHIAPTNDPVDLTVVGDQLAIRSTSWAYDIACTWEKAARLDVGLPVNATLLDKVAFGLAHDQEQVEALGLTGVIGPAMAELRSGLRLPRRSSSTSASPRGSFARW